MSNTPAAEIVWIDCEMTGLDVDKDGLCEIAIIITDFDLKPLDKGLTLVINPGAEVLAQMDDFVRKMHTDSGLIEEIPAGLSVAAAESQAIEYVNKYVKKGQRAIVAGNTIGMDRRFISKYMPTLDETLHYRSIDVSTIKELARRWYPKAFYETPEKNGGHRALADIAESIRELAYFRDSVMVAAPGPDSKTSKQLSSDVIKNFAGLIDS